MISHFAVDGLFFNSKQEFDNHKFKGQKYNNNFLRLDWLFLIETQRTFCIGFYLIFVFIQ